MFEIEVESHFSAAHRVCDYGGACERLHGHNYRVRVALAGRELDRAGMLADFKVAKAALGRLADELDHRYLNEDVPAFGPGGVNATAENIAKWIFEGLARDLAAGLGARVRVARVTVWESEGSAASYVPD